MDKPRAQTRGCPIPRPAGPGPALAAAALLLLLGACARSAGPNPAEAGPRTDDLALLPARIQAIADPAHPALDRDFLLTLRATAPDRLRVVFPDLTAFDDRLEGFAVEGRFDREPQTREGQTVWERCLRLRPLPGVEHRLAPFAVGLARGNGAAPPSEWVATRPVVYDAAPLIERPADARVGALRGPRWIRPSFGRLMLGLLAAAALALLGVALWKLARRIRRAIALRRLSPRERALFELHELLERGWIENRRIKEFYFELTLIVRRYIERAHAIRAPEQTTEEFLDAVSRDARFSRETIRRLRAFLQAADLVKYAAHRPDAPAIDEATATARQYIENDDDARPLTGGPHVPVR